MIYGNNFTGGAFQIQYLVTESVYSSGVHKGPAFDPIVCGHSQPKDGHKQNEYRYHQQPQREDFHFNRGFLVYPRNIDVPPIKGNGLRVVGVSMENTFKEYGVLCRNLDVKGLRKKFGTLRILQGND